MKMIPERDDDETPVPMVHPTAAGVVRRRTCQPKRGVARPMVVSRGRNDETPPEGGRVTLPIRHSVLHGAGA